MYFTLSFANLHIFGETVPIKVGIHIKHVWLKNRTWVIMIQRLFETRNGYIISDGWIKYLFTFHSHWLQYLFWLLFSLMWWLKLIYFFGTDYILLCSQNPHIDLAFEVSLGHAIYKCAITIFTQLGLIIEAFSTCTSQYIQIVLNLKCGSFTYNCIVKMICD